MILKGDNFKSYNSGIRRLVKFWVDYIERYGIVLRLYPFLGVVQSLLKGEDKTPLRCGAGWAAKVFVGELCMSCRIFNVCEGRCLYANVTRRWKPETYRFMCKTVENMVEAIACEVPRIRRLIDAGKIKIENFEFIQYIGCEVIP